MARIEGETADLEREVSAAIASKLGREPDRGGLFVPTRLRPQAAGLDTKTNAAGNFIVQTEVRDLIELLRNRAKVINPLGATVLSGLQGNIQFPKQLTGSAGQWMEENSGSDVTQSDATFGALVLSPKTYMATTAFSRQLLAQSSVDVEALVRKDLAIAHALAIDLAALDGTGSNNQPLGLLRTAGVGSVQIAANGGGAPTYAKILDLETAIADANADSDQMRLLTTPQVRGQLRKTPLMDSNYVARPVWEKGSAPGVGDVCGYSAYVSKQVPSNKTSGVNSDCHAIILGSWSSLIVAEWGVFSVVIDPYTAKRKGLIECTSFQLVDIAVRQPAQFSAIQDCRPNA
jgi:HK97 family phage major capsid protein